MAKFVQGKSGVVFDEDIYDGEIIEVKEDHSDAYDKEQYALQIKISDPEGEFDGKTIRYWVTRYFDGEGPDAVEVLVEKSNLLKALMAANPEIDFAESNDDFEIPVLLLNQRVRVNIRNKPKPDGSKKSYVDSLLAPSKKRRAAAAAA